MSFLRRSRAVECYFCRAPAANVASSSSSVAGVAFRCAECGASNRYDARGEIMSDEPAMHDERLNARSFARRAAPRQNRLPSEYASPGAFCRACTTNQALLVNLRAAFLPDPADPAYAARAAALPEYEASLLARYPPVCDACAPGAQAELARKDALARATAMGGFLRASRSRGRGRTPAREERPRAGRRMHIWRARGGLWMLTTLASLALSAYYAAGKTLAWLTWPAALVLPLLVLASVTWTFWDPTYASAQRRAPVTDARRHARARYIRVQALAWALRLCSAGVLTYLAYTPYRNPRVISPHGYPSARARPYFAGALLAELGLLAAALHALRPARAPQIRLLDPYRARSGTPLSRGGTPAPLFAPALAASSSEPDVLAALSLSGAPVLAPGAPHPVFGAPSLRPARAASAPALLGDDDGEFDDGAAWPPRTDADADADAMDVDPPAPRADGGAGGGWIRPQRFFAPERPTGLEALLARTALADAGAGAGLDARTTGTLRTRADARWHWGWVYAASLVPVLGLGLKAWFSR